MMLLILLALAPVFIILFYVYFRDKYEREPIGLLFRALLAGGLIIIPVYFIESGLSSLGSSVWDVSSRTIWNAFG